MTTIRRLVLAATNPGLIFRRADANKYFPGCVYVHTNWSCNATCPMCFCHEMLGNREFMEMGTYRAIVRQCKGRARSICFFGGEPTLHPHLPEMVDMARKAGLLTYVYTNGIAVERIAPQLCDAGLHEIIIAYNGYDDATFEAATGVKYSCQKVRAGIRALLGCGKLFPQISTLFTPIRERISTLSASVMSAREAGADCTMVFGVWWRPASMVEQASRDDFQIGVGSTDEDYLTDRQWDLLQKQIALAKPDVVRPHARCRDWYRLGDKPYKCLAIGSIMDICPDGKIAICNGAVEIGHMACNRIDEAWQGKTRRLIEESLARHESMPRCYRCCKKEFCT